MNDKVIKAVKIGCVAVGAALSMLGNVLGEKKGDTKKNDNENQE